MIRLILEAENPQCESSPVGAAASGCPIPAHVAAILLRVGPGPMPQQCYDFRRDARDSL